MYDKLLLLEFTWCLWGIKFEDCRYFCRKGGYIILFSREHDLIQQSTAENKQFILAAKRFLLIDMEEIELNPLNRKGNRQCEVILLYFDSWYELFLNRQYIFYIFLFHIVFALLLICYFLV